MMKSKQFFAVYTVYRPIKLLLRIILLQWRWFACLQRWVKVRTKAGYMALKYAKSPLTCKVCITFNDSRRLHPLLLL